MKERYTFSREKLKDIIKSKGLTQAKMSTALGRSHGYLSNVIISNEFLKGLERYYGIRGEQSQLTVLKAQKTSQKGLKQLNMMNFTNAFMVLYIRL